jgi:16S rRNA (guanine527-N7)-methyltransferase
MAAKVDELVDRVSADLAAELSQPARSAILVWLDRLAEWNARIDLTAARSPEELVDLMLADALVLSSRIPAGSQVVDVGTGAGAPGLPLALLREDLRMTLVEPLGKRVSFLRTVLGAIGRTDVQLERSRGEALAGRRFDSAISRATLSPQDWLTLGVELVEPGGRVWVLVAADAPPCHPKASLVEDFQYEWPLTKAQRRLAAYEVARVA